MSKSIEDLSRRQVNGIKRIKDTLRNRRSIENNGELSRMLIKAGYFLEGLGTPNVYVCYSDGKKVRDESGRALKVPQRISHRRVYDHILTRVLTDAQERYSGVLD